MYFYEGQFAINVKSLENVFIDLLSYIAKYQDTDQNISIKM